MSLLPFLMEEAAHPLSRRDWVSMLSPEDAIHPLLNTVLSQLANIKKDTSITLDKDSFQANIDVQQFKPEEISVKLTGDNTITIEGKHEEKQDEHGYISRHFVRRYELPDDCDVKKLQSKLSSDGVLSITAPKKPETKQPESRQIPIIKTGPIRSVEEKKGKDINVQRV